MLKRLHLPHRSKESTGPSPTQPTHQSLRHHVEICNQPNPSESADSGLHLVHDPGGEPCIDMIFLHGLGGGSYRTWSWGHDHQFFWPGLWLPRDPKTSKARIFTYGYNADFRVPGRSLSTITDFAKSLLFDMRFCRNDRAEDLKIGKFPILFIAHSMGGLVVKKAILLGQHDENYQGLVHSINAIVFLATPHRGTQLADSLQRILQVTLRSGKDFVTDLSRNSHALEDINEQFRHVAPNFSIWSFYESRATDVTVSKVMVLERESSVLGYTGEVSVQLDADHHSVCKYHSPSDPNYVKVLNAIRSTIEELKSEPQRSPEATSLDKSATAFDIRSLLRHPVSVENDLQNLSRYRVKGTCEWIWNQPEVQRWRAREIAPIVLWYAAPPGSGKSTCAAYVVEEALSQRIHCEYFFFRNGDQQRLSIAEMLISLAFQTAQTLPQYRHELGATLSTSGGFERGDAQSIWRQLFLDILKRVKLRVPLFWVIDALDESESPKTFFDMLHDISNENLPIRIFLTSRSAENLNRAYRRLPRSLPTMMMDKVGSEDSSSDISKYAHHELQHLYASDELKRRVHEAVLARAGGNFLWVKLVLDDLPHCHTEKDIENTLKEIPDDMGDLYQRIDDYMVKNLHARDLLLATALLEWVICAPVSMALSELNQALSSEYPGLFDLRRTIQDTCGQFVVVDQSDRLALLHLTARDYLLNTSRNALAVDRMEGSKKLLLTSLTTLSDSQLRNDLALKGLALGHSKPFTFYAAKTWSYYLRHVDPTDSATLDLLVQFFSRPSVLCWMQVLILLERLDLIIKAAKAMIIFISQNRKANLSRNPLLHRITEVELLESWTIDLVKIVGKFNKPLRSDHSAVYKILPAICPLNSPINKQFCYPGLTDVVISPADESWTDNLATFSLPGAERPLELACAGSYIAVLAQGGTVHIWASVDFKETCRLKHTESVTAIRLNSKGTLLAAYGLLTTKVWCLPSGSLLCSTLNPPYSRAMTLQFRDNDHKLLSGCSDRKVRQLALDEIEAGWQPFDSALLREDAVPKGMFVNSPICMSFSPDGNSLAVAYRGFPLSVWAVDIASLVGRCRRVAKTKQQGSQTTNWCAVDQMTWNPISGHVVGLYRGGVIFKWHPLTDDYQEITTVADEVACSPDGKLFATSDTEGTIRVWNFAHFSIIYQLKSDDLVTALIFSPDATRLYDIRGSVINAWEPNGLLRLAEADEWSSDVASTLFSHISEQAVTSTEALTALALSPSQTKYCAANEAGETTVYCIATHCNSTINSLGTFMGVHHIVWSQDSQRFATLHLGADICAHEVNVTGADNQKTLNVRQVGHPKFPPEARSPHQILLNHDGTLLLAILDDQMQMWDIDKSPVMLVASLSDGSSAFWMPHPRDRKSFLAFRYDSITTFSWKNLEQTAWSSTTMSVSAVEQAVERKVTKVLMSSESPLSVVQIQTRSKTGQIDRHHLTICLLPPFESGTGGNRRASVNAHELPGEVIAKIHVPLGIITGPRLVFLDQDFWVSSCPLPPKASNLATTKRHYFIPRDWASAKDLEMCSILDDGTLLVPRGGDVVTVKSRLGPLQI